MIMPTTCQNDFESKRAQALIYLKAMINVSRRLNTLSYHHEFQEHIQKLIGLESKLKGAIKPNLQDQDLKHIPNSGNIYLIIENSETSLINTISLLMNMLRRHTTKQKT
jgi:hypothetical protein